jgi:hypothetical protein
MMMGRSGIDPLLDLPADGPAVGAGQHGVEEDEIGLVEAVEGLLGVGGATDAVAVSLEEVRERLPGHGLVVHDQDGGLLRAGHGARHFG